MLLVGFEPTISVDERQQACDLERAATGICTETTESVLCKRKIHKWTFVKTETISNVTGDR